MKFTKKTFKNGLRILAIPMKDNETVTLMTLVEAGSDHEQKEEGGISHFLEHMCFKGTVKRPNSQQINYEFDAMGSQSNAFTTNEYTGFYAKSHHSHLPKVLDLISDVFLNSIFPEAEIEKEKGVVIEEINMYEDRPEQKVYEVLEELLYGDQPAGRSVLGTKQSVQSLTRDKIMAYRNKHYTAENTVIVIAGKIDETTIYADIERAFNTVQTNKREAKSLTVENQPEPALKIHFKDSDQTHFILSWRAFNNHDPRLPAVSLLATILGKGMSSRLFHKMREELGICYYIYASQSPKADRGTFSIFAGVSNSRLSEAIKAILVEIKKITEVLIEEKEMKKAKDFRIGNLSLGLESSDSYADFYGFQEIMREDITTPEERIAKMQKVTPQQIKEVARTIFTKETINLAIVGPQKDSKELQDILDSF